MRPDPWLVHFAKRHGTLREEEARFQREEQVMGFNRPAERLIRPFVRRDARDSRGAEGWRAHFEREERRDRNVALFVFVLLPIVFAVAILASVFVEN